MTLYVIGTPIGNLQDITLRALETLKNVDKIYCEDTRRTKILLDAYHISKPIDSLHQHSSETKLIKIAQELGAGQDIAYLTDAGTPGISDPGGKLVEFCRAKGLSVVPIPGPSALTTLLSVAGIPTDSFWFAGFLPTKKGRQTQLKKILAFSDPVVLFETGPRIARLCRELTELGSGELHLIVGRELTKKFEEILTGTPAEISAHFTAHKPLGEFVVCLARQR
ncbi:MAG TPA: 16S rRNA (cytidine(1402)-2'-O)-methyltransferase [Candidatus Saccharimonadales bacterium]|nr:16S rRNA (cytidine(1402)-2'-O)-methyltransferase [Candidatus Saccharimonadales bacterium]